MKDYNEMAESVFRRRDTYIIEKRKQRKKLTTAACSFCLCALLGVGAWQSDLIGNQPSVDAEHSATEDPVRAIKGTLVINELTAEDAADLFATDYAFFDLSEDRFHDISRQEAMEYLGVSFDLSDLLPEFAESPDARYGYYEFDDGWRWDQQNFYYYDGGDRAVTITMRKDAEVFSQVAPEDLFEMLNVEKSEIQGTSVTAVHFEEGGFSTYYATFRKDDLGVTVWADNLTEDEFIKTVIYLLTNV